ncbi:unnamed protein product (macronuclear) [Paramecium tetraurelia]|uniref:protein-tyrosine-phosphatase n=1 Tax=Paramecium tetraurelia TaxID=5888 RepID=A0CAD0_PARTE|nr:uncharacterized protein GSPATT00036527001 [Paramecium tetraurelia]CAK67747.1 unnamed protein product [Paramecium tetraurelia]|eukprot:XP_001435144.1 hypothetical protein (macronuclear) [Paramecium tetraurelia strain d4-2]
MSSLVTQADSELLMIKQNEFKEINDDFPTMGLFCRKKVKREQVDNSQCCLVGTQKIKEIAEDQKEQDVGINKYIYDINKILKEQQEEELILEHRVENSIQYICGETLVKAMKQPDLVIYDCRYQYEFEGGHIMGAVHMNHSINLFDELFNQSQYSKKIVVLYCEFSIKRSLEKYFEIRKLDRNINQYPKLTYNNLYLLCDGYSKFYQNFSHLCNGFYISMNDPAYEQQLDQEQQRRIIVKQKSNYRKSLVVSI